MGIFKDRDTTKKIGQTRFAGSGGKAEISPLRPRAVEKEPPCRAHCPSGNDIRGWLTTIAIREKLGLSLEAACDEAWHTEVDTNPFPSVMGRVCPHPCESHCNRNDKDGSVAINSVERFIGDWGIERKLRLAAIDGEGPYREKIAVVGSGPSGLSCAYQLARRGYPVTVFEAFDKPGGMLRYGIPEYRLPRAVLDAEISRILDLGVELKLGTTIGGAMSLDALRREYSAVFVGIGAHKGKTMGIPGESGSGVYSGTDFLNRANSGREIEVGTRVVVVGGGDTAIDAARVSLRLGTDAASMSRRLGARVTILYRRTRAEMPAIEHEIEDALEEGITIEYLAAPARVIRDESGAIVRLAIQRFELGEPDASGRRRPVAIEGAIDEIEADTLVMAVSQAPDWSALGAFGDGGSWLQVDEFGRTGIDGVWSGGDTLSLGLATISIGQGRRAAEAIHATLRGRELRAAASRPSITSDRIKLNWYPARERAARTVLPAAERLARPKDEVDLGVTAEAALAETTRCFSCGLCFACENCWMYCQSGCFKKVTERSRGHFFDINLAVCDGCKKCGEECPCGFLDLN